MALAQLEIFSSKPSGSSVFIEYDDQTLIATGLIATCPANAESDLSFSYQLPLVGLASAIPPTQPINFVPASDIPTSWLIKRGSALVQTVFAVPLQCYIQNGAPKLPFNYYAGHDGPVAANAVSMSAVP